MEAHPTIPSPLEDDDEDVHWALSTASALWGRGERSEALKWLRRAAETASDANADQRSLELFKAAAEVAQKLVSLPPPPPSGSAAPPPLRTSAPPPTQASAPLPTPGSRPPPARSAPPPGVHVVTRSGGPPPPLPVRRPSTSTALKQTMMSPVAPIPAPSSKRAPVAHLKAAPPTPPPRSSPVAAPRSSPVAARPTPSTRSSAPSSSQGGARGQVSAASLDFGVDHGHARNATPAGNSSAHSAGAPMVHPREPPSSERNHHSAPPREAQPEPQRARTRTRPNIERRFDDEVTVRRDIASLGVRLDDLDEDTKVIPGRQQLGRVMLSVDPFRSDAPSDEETRDGEGIANHLTTPFEGPDADANAVDGRTPLSAGWLRAQHDGVPSTMPAAQLAALPSLKVAVLGTSEQGDVRVLPLAPGSAAPSGAATAILVPLTQEDGEAIGRLFDPPKAGRR